MLIKVCPIDQRIVLLSECESCKKGKKKEEKEEKASVKNSLVQKMMDEVKRREQTKKIPYRCIDCQFCKERKTKMETSGKVSYYICENPDSEFYQKEFNEFEVPTKVCVKFQKEKGKNEKILC